MKKQAMQSEALNLFVSRLIEEKKFDNLDPEIVEQIKNDLLERVEDRINASILGRMPAEKLEDFNELLDKGNTEKIQLFCRENIQDLDDIIAKELMNFRSIYLTS